ncbi:putative reverse transcriptase domain-containing protein [Tanacetum coccineum]
MRFTIDCFSAPSLENVDLDDQFFTIITSEQLVEIDKFIKGCKLEIEGHVFDIDLIPFWHGSFDVIIGMDWLSNHKAEIICHEKVVRIPLQDGKVLRVLGEKPKEKAIILMNAKGSDKSQEEIIVVGDFPEVFSDDLSGLPPTREIEFRIELNPLDRNVHGCKVSLSFGTSELGGVVGTTQGTPRQRFHPTKLIALGCADLEDHVMYLDPSKIETVKNWKAPRTPSKVCSFLGLAGYYRRFIEYFSKLGSSKANMVVDALTPSTIPKAKSITFRDPGESTTRTTLTPIPSNIKDKGKAKMIKPEKPLKKKEKIRLNEELALKLQAEEEEQARLARKKAEKDEEANIS